MVKHGASHGLSVLLCTVVSAYLVEISKTLLPKFFERVSHIGMKIREFIHVPLSDEYFNILLMATILAIIWGIFFKLRFVRD